ncbi:MAG: redoxin family protein, partial [Gammaproteobacteria bacterium]|nr:redoxin family protein [Gammaproteobacteria bacterium]
MPDQERIRNFLRQRSGLFLNVLLFVAIFFAISAFQARNLLSTASTTAPALSGPLLRGGNYDISAPGKQPVLVYFFAPWCSFCAASSDNLTRLRRLRDEDSLAIIAVALSWEDFTEVRNYVDRHDLDLPVLLGDRQIAQDWR